MLDILEDLLVLRKHKFGRLAISGPAHTAERRAAGEGGGRDAILTISALCAR